MVAGPVIGAGKGFTDILRVAKQPVLSVYVMSAVPTDMPSILPVVVFAITFVLLAVQVPPVTLLDRAMAEF